MTRLAQFKIVSSRTLAVLVFGVALMFSMPVTSYADGGGSAPVSSKPKCKVGEIYDKKTKKCVDEENSSLEQDSIFETGRALAYAEKYDDAIRVLGLVKDKSDPRVLNMLGFSYRKSGNMELALSYYQKSINQDPDYSLVREYLGEAYVKLGMLEKAREQLTEIERICEGRNCGEYRQLATLMVNAQL